MSRRTVAMLRRNSAWRSSRSLRLVIVRAQTPRVHELPLTPEHVHWGYYDARLAPALRVASGDRVRVETMVAGGLQRLRLAGVPEADIPESLKAVEQRVTERGPGAHPMSGPIFVEGAAARRYARSPDRRDRVPARLRCQRLQPGRRRAAGRLSVRGSAAVPVASWSDDRVEFKPGITLPLAPFFGSMGVAPPPLVGRISSRPPGWHGGNLDNKDLVAGSVLYLPVHVPGALLSIGDGHALQGDGEVTGTALETSLRGTFELRVLKGQRLRWPRAETPTHYIAMGLHEDLDEATKLAVREMVEFLMAEKKLSRDEAYMLCSLAADLHVTQAVDATKGVHATVAKAIFK